MARDVDYQMLIKVYKIVMINTHNMLPRFIIRENVRKNSNGLSVSRPRQSNSC